MVYLYVVAILLANLLVAILTFAFEGAARQARIHFYMDLVSKTRKLEYDSAE